MKPFDVFTSIAAPMPDADIDTDIIFPARFLTLTQKRGLGPYAFRDKRFDDAGRERADFVLHREPWRHAGILVTGPNFGCGSSREQAPWSLADLGIRCLIGPGFGDIFEANCHRNGMLPVALAGDPHDALMRHAAAGGTVTVDLVQRTVGFADRVIAFDLPDATRAMLLDGTDEIDRILDRDRAAIAAYVAERRRRAPWLSDDPPSPESEWPNRS